MSTGYTGPVSRQLAPTGGFRCDLCGEPIEDTTAAWGQWFLQRSPHPDGKSRNWGFSIVHGEAHSVQCTLEKRNGPSIGDWQLSYLLTADGLATMMEFFVEREVDS